MYGLKPMPFKLKPLPFKLKPVPLLRRGRVVSAAYTPPFTLIVGESCAS